jgi:hypothetical protein
MTDDEERWLVRQRQRLGIRDSAHPNLELRRR